jgi:hypothetical protein
LGVAAGRDVHVDDLAVLVDSPVDVAPPARDVHIGLVDVPTVTEHVATRSGSIDEERRGALHQPVHGDVVDLDATLAQELLEGAVGQPENGGYQRTARTITSGGNRKPLKAELEPGETGRR